ncbi:hypothetical protein [Spiroplasma endosymbiont of Othius punctulatus]|uniref:hypothetical protein n=1 Tax=Spiroplasma endosymbiont of Othius punctulatus TaxID=3066289 RepID=UPI0030CE3B9E
MRVGYKSTINLTTIACYSAMVFAMQWALYFLPNVELVTLMISFSVILFPFWMSASVCVAFTMLDVLIYGFMPWVILYLIVWPLLCLTTFLLKKIIEKQWLVFVLINTIFGLLFGSVDTLIFYFLYGFNNEATLVYWIKSIPFDLIHGASNFLIALTLYKPLSSLKTKLRSHYEF